MKNEEQKIRSRVNIGANDADWETIQKAIAIKGVPQSEFLREAALKEARRIVGKAGK